jgi:enediyne polyketide synthase
LPVGAECVELGLLDPSEDFLVAARETWSNGNEWTYDIDVCNPDGRVIERWSGLHLVRLTPEHAQPEAPYALGQALVQTLVQRVASDILGVTGLHVGMVREAPAQTATHDTLVRALGGPVALTRDDRGAPRVPGFHVSATHSRGITIAIAHRTRPLACDLEFMPDYEEPHWRLMLGESRHAFAIQLAARTALSTLQACLAAWTASECLIKMGRTDWPFTAALASSSTTRTGPCLDLRGADIQLAVTFFKISDSEVEAALALALGPCDSLPDAAGASPGDEASPAAKPLTGKGHS